MQNESSSSVRVFYPEFSREALLTRLQAGLAQLDSVLHLKRVVLFGSWARGRATAFSDIDLLVIYQDPPKQDAYKLVRRCLRLRGLEPHVYTEREAAKVQQTLDRMTQDGISLL